MNGIVNNKYMQFVFHSVCCRATHQKSYHIWYGTARLKNIGDIMDNLLAQEIELLSQLKGEIVSLDLSNFKN